MITRVADRASKRITNSKAATNVGLNSTLRLCQCIVQIRKGACSSSKNATIKTPYVLFVT